MALRRVGSLNEYAESLRNDPGEAKALAQDILIHVTSFFRDAAAFEALKQHVLPELLAHKDEDATFRVWVPGCATGEEAYSLAICLLEFFAEQEPNPLHQDLRLGPERARDRDRSGRPLHGVRPGSGQPRAACAVLRAG